MSLKAPVMEIYSAIQGEGKYVGVRQIFLRFLGCNISCRYCDTPASRNMTPDCLIEESAGERKFRAAKNPVGVEEVLNAVRNLKPAIHHSLSLTGGEPLLYPEFLQEFLPFLKEDGIKIFLETNGTLAGSLRKVLPLIDIVSMDFKLPSATGEKDFSSPHKEFMEIAGNKEFYIKMTLTDDTVDEEIERALKIISNSGKSIQLFLQPATPAGNVLAPGIDKLRRWQEQSLQYLLDVRVIPQTHKMLKEI
ncbi:MAG: 7-carboxy-7-deazaguanine synthase QueE [Firmicutes bacterium]|nr:7-carboxy-7-deazaguanine synthase QueE [Bacillota bacterium]